MNLRRINLAVGLAHLVQATLMLALSNDLALPVTASWASGDPVVARMPSALEEVFALAIGPAVALFLLLAAADHLVVAAPGVHAGTPGSSTTAATTCAGSSTRLAPR